MSYSEHWRREFLARHPEYERQPQVLQQEPVEPTFTEPADPLPWSAALPQATATLSLPSVVTHVTGPSEVAEAVPNKLHETGQEKLLPSEIVTQACYLRRRLQLTQQAFATQMGIMVPQRLHSQCRIETAAGGTPQENPAGTGTRQLKFTH